MKKLLLAISVLFSIQTNAQVDKGRIIELSPSLGTQGESMSVTLSGQNTNFTAFSSFTNPNSYSGIRFIPLFDSYTSLNGVQTSQIQVIDDETIELSLELTANAPIGKYAIVINEKTLFPAFEVKNSGYSVALTSLSNKEGTQGETLTAILSGQNTDFTGFSSFTNPNSYSGLRFIPIFNSYTSTNAITTNALTVLDDESIEVNFSIPENAIIGNYAISLKGQYLYPAFTVNLGTNSVAISSAVNTKAKLGEELTITLKGQNTSFSSYSSLKKASPAIEFIPLFDSNNSSSPIIVTSVTVIDDETLEVTIIVPEDAETGEYGVRLAEENLTLFPALHVERIKKEITSITENTTTEQVFKIFPTVVDETLTITSTIDDSNIKIQVYTMQGLLINTLTKGNFINEASYNLGSLASGIYLVVISDHKEVLQTNKIIKQ